MPDHALAVLSDAGGRMRLQARWFRGESVLAVAIEDAVDAVTGVRAVHAYPRTASVVVWYAPTRCEKEVVLAAVSATTSLVASYRRRS